MKNQLITGDDDVDQIVRAAAKAAGLSVPATIAARNAVPDAFARLGDLAATRAWNLTKAVRLEAAPDVEFATHNARVVMIDDFHAGGTAIADNVEACASRAHARRLALVDQVWDAEQRVESLAHAHVATLESLRRQFQIHLGVLDAAIRATRGGKHLTYTTPTDIAIPTDAFDVGLSRVRCALTQHHTTTRPATTPDNGNTEKGAA